MVVADRTPARRAAGDAGPADGAWLGLAQAAALVPGVSRSGATRAAARARGFGRADAAALSREVALPVLAGAAALKGFRLARRRPTAGELRTLAAGAAAAMASTWAALRAKRALTADAPLAGWAAYRAALAVAVLAVWHDQARSPTPTPSPASTPRPPTGGSLRWSRCCVDRPPPPVADDPAAGPLRGGAEDRARPRAGARDRRCRLEADRGRADGPLRHGRHRLRGDECQRHRVRGRRADRAARLPRRRAGRPPR